VVWKIRPSDTSSDKLLLNRNPVEVKLISPFYWTNTRCILITFASKTLKFCSIVKSWYSVLLWITCHAISVCWRGELYMVFCVAEDPSNLTLCYDPKTFFHSIIMMSLRNQYVGSHPLWYEGPFSNHLLFNRTWYCGSMDLDTDGEMRRNESAKSLENEGWRERGGGIYSELVCLLLEGALPPFPFPLNL